jgi:hypothetical protein
MKSQVQEIYKVKSTKKTKLMRFLRTNNKSQVTARNNKTGVTFTFELRKGVASYGVVTLILTNKTIIGRTHLGFWCGGKWRWYDRQR